MWEQRLLGRAGVRVWMSCMASVTSSVVTGAQRMERLFPALSSRTVLVLMGSCSGLSPDLSGAKFSLVMPSEDVQGEHLPFLECCLHHHYYPRENSLRFCFLSEITNTHPKDRWDGFSQGSFAEFCCVGWGEGERGGHGAETEGLEGVSCSPLHRGCPCRQSWVRWHRGLGLGGRVRSLECQGLLASECDCGVSGGVWNSELHQGDVTQQLSHSGALVRPRLWCSQGAVGAETSLPLVVGWFYLAL